MHNAQFRVLTADCLLLMIDRDFEKFRGGPTPGPAERIHVTLDHKHVIGLNENVYRLLGKPTAVYLYFSRSTDTIAIEPLQHSRLLRLFPSSPKQTPPVRAGSSALRPSAGTSISASKAPKNSSPPSSATASCS
jgi:hypothetical protein